MQDRRHDIDALRALAFASLILYHLCMLYVADWEWHIKSPHLAEWLQWPMLFMNRWRMDLIFLVSGIASAFLLKSGQAWRFLWQRHNRLVIPLVFGCLFVVPIQPYVQAVSNGAAEPGFIAFLGKYFTGGPWPKGAFDGWEHSFTWNHLWYLTYLWIYTIALFALWPLLDSSIGKRVRARLTSLRGPALLVLPMLPTLAWTLLLQTRFPDVGDFIHDWYRNTMYFTFFLYGFVLAKDAGLWEEIQRLRKISLAVALGFGAAYLGLVASLPDDVGYGTQVLIWVLRNIYVWTMLLTLLGWSKHYLNKPFRWLPWAREAVYPWYILHQSLIVLMAYWLIPLRFSGPVEALLVLLGTVTGCWGIFAIVRRVNFLRPLFGLKRLAAEAPAEHAAFAVRHQAVEGARVAIENQGQEMPVAFPQR